MVGLLVDALRLIASEDRVPWPLTFDFPGYAVTSQPGPLGGLHQPLLKRGHVPEVREAGVYQFR